jgi:hypothetical protein
LDEAVLLDHLEELAQRLGIEVRYEDLQGEAPFQSGGLCRIHDKQFIIVHARAGIKEKNLVLARALRRFDLDGVYLKPALRDFLENSGR